MKKHMLVLLVIVGGLILFAMLQDWAWTIQRILWWFAKISYQIGKSPLIGAAVAVFIVGFLILQQEEKS